ncbi:PilX family type IV pilin [Neisseria chenwenguii]|uniref:Type IV pilin n=1 Tax=Neisseria chenwenguii TaxID=1853278 RepID=A0A220S3Q4_9NEIS|nr:PilX family type IV pilin [Neisseria chenwenguii]ASK28131.1 type IV pilin [Neisseria chenwenguii]ROV57281.1 prepilin-type N-terminal cleavage/methylation domain-containing protein [Neisseria chenwenguii]
MKRQTVHGFTLVEMMITIAIIGILASIALPSYNRYIERGYRAQAHSELVDINNQIKTWLLKNPSSLPADVQTKLGAFKDFNDPQLKTKYTLTAAMEDVAKGRRYRLSATPKAGSGYKLSVWMDSNGNAYFCDTAAGATDYKKTKTDGCEPK